MKPISRDLVGAVLFLVLGGAIAGIAVQLPMGSVRFLGPGALPAAIGFVLMVLAVVLLFQAKRAPEVELSPADVDEQEPWGGARVMLVCALIAVFVLVLPVIGFLLAAIMLMVAFYLIGAGRLGIGPTAAGVVTALAAYLLFALALDVPLPGGWLWGY